RFVRPRRVTVCLDRRRREAVKTARGPRGIRRRKALAVEMKELRPPKEYFLSSWGYRGIEATRCGILDKTNSWNDFNAGTRRPWSSWPRPTAPAFISWRYDTSEQRHTPSA